MLLYFIRHGQTDWNKDMRMQGQSDIPLNENGRESAIEAGKTLANTHIDLAFSSPLKRAKETAELVLAGRDIPIIEDKRIEEICFGICEGMKGRDENGQAGWMLLLSSLHIQSSIRHQKTVRMRKCSARVHGTSLRISQQEKSFRTNLF